MKTDLLENIEEFLGFISLLESHGIYTVEEFISIHKANPEGMLSLLEIDKDTLDRLVVKANNHLDQDEADALESTQIKEIGKDYKLGMLTRDDEKAPRDGEGASETAGDECNSTISDESTNGDKAHTSNEKDELNDDIKEHKEDEE